ncbi:MAG: hypothetical protein WCX71_03695 [Candidatus Buchananbacteria bacterium]
MIIIVGFWSLSLKDSLLKNSLMSGQPEEIDGVKTEIGSLVADLKNNLSGLQSKIKQLEKTEGVSTTTNQLNDLKEKIVEQQTQNWASYTNDDFGFTIKYPIILLPLIPPSSTEDVVIFQPIGTSTAVYKIKKFSSYNNLMNMRYLVNVWQKDEIFLAAFDYQESTTTQLMSNTIKSIENNL